MREVNLYSEPSSLLLNLSSVPFVLAAGLILDRERQLRDFCVF